MFTKIIVMEALQEGKGRSKAVLDEIFLSHLGNGNINNKWRLLMT
jgi:hypothetical protein